MHHFIWLVQKNLTTIFVQIETKITVIKNSHHRNWCSNQGPWIPDSNNDFLQPLRRKDRYPSDSSRVLFEFLSDRAACTPHFYLKLGSSGRPRPRRPRSLSPSFPSLWSRFWPISNVKSNHSRINRLSFELMPGSCVSFLNNFCWKRDAIVRYLVENLMEYLNFVSKFSSGLP